jgi:hypothetical protein
MSSVVGPHDDTPLSIEPAVGWRVWQLILTDGGDLRLTAVAHAVVWPPQQAMPARCARARHPAPQAACTCGYYSTSSIEDLAGAGVFARGIGVIGTISVWGTVIEHSRGARSRYAYPARLRLVCSPCLQQGSIVDPVTVAGGAWLIPLCGRHPRSRREGHLAAPAVQAELLATYGVELLPMPSVTSFPRRPGDLHPIPQRSRRSWAGVVTALWLLIHVLAGIGAPEDAVAGGSVPSPPPASSSALAAHGAPHPVVEPHGGMAATPVTPEFAVRRGVSHSTWIGSSSLYRSKPCRPPSARAASSYRTGPMRRRPGRARRRPRTCTSR